MSIIGPILLGFFGAMVIWIFDLKANVWHEKEKKEKRGLSPEEKKKRVKGYIIFIGGWILLIILVVIGKHYGL